MKWLVVLCLFLPSCTITVAPIKPQRKHYHHRAHHTTKHVKPKPTPTPSPAPKTNPIVTPYPSDPRIEDIIKQLKDNPK